MVSAEKRERLRELVSKGMSIRQAAIKLKINYSTAKHNMKNMDNSDSQDQNSWREAILPKKRLASQMGVDFESDEDYGEDDDLDQEQIC